MNDNKQQQNAQQQQQAPQQQQQAQIQRQQVENQIQVQQVQISQDGSDQMHPQGNRVSFVDSSSFFFLFF